MTRLVLLGGLAALLLGAVPSHAGDGGRMAGVSSFVAPRPTDEAPCGPTDRHRQVEPEGQSRWASVPSPRPRTAYGRYQPAERPTTTGHAQGRGERPWERTHSASCACSPCRRRSASSPSATQVVVLASTSPRDGDSVVVLRDGRRRSDGGWGDSPSNDYGAQFGFARPSSEPSRLRTHADPDCRVPGTILASSGKVYLQVRADGRLTIRAR